MDCGKTFSFILPNASPHPTRVSRHSEGEGRPLPTQQDGPSSQQEPELHLHRWKLTVTSFDPRLQTNTVAAAAQRAALRAFWSGTGPRKRGGFCFHLPLASLCLLSLTSAGEEVSQKQGVTGLWVKSHLELTHTQALTMAAEATKHLTVSTEYFLMMHFIRV